MSVYVDDMFAGYGRMKMCHMVADTREELDEMADTIGVLRKWIQSSGTHREHYDICKAKREQALQSGAIAISQKELGKMTRARRLQVSAGDPAKESQELS